MIVRVIFGFPENLFPKIRIVLHGIGHEEKPVSVPKNWRTPSLVLICRVKNFLQDSVRSARINEMRIVIELTDFNRYLT